MAALRGHERLGPEASPTTPGLVPPPAPREPSSATAVSHARAGLEHASGHLRPVLAGDVDHLPALLRRKAAPDVPRGQRNPHRSEAPGQLRPRHAPILAQAVSRAPTSRSLGGLSRRARVSVVLVAVSPTGTRLALAVCGQGGGRSVRHRRSRGHRRHRRSRGSGRRRRGRRGRGSGCRRGAGRRPSGRSKGGSRRAGRLRRRAASGSRSLGVRTGRSSRLGNETRRADRGGAGRVTASPSPCPSVVRAGTGRTLEPGGRSRGRHGPLERRRGSRDGALRFPGRIEQPGQTHRRGDRPGHQHRRYDADGGLPHVTPPVGR